MSGAPANDRALTLNYNNLDELLPKEYDQEAKDGKPIFTAKSELPDSPHPSDADSYDRPHTKKRTRPHQFT